MERIKKVRENARELEKLWLCRSLENILIMCGGNFVFSKDIVYISPATLGLILKGGISLVQATHNF